MARVGKDLFTMSSFRSARCPLTGRKEFIEQLNRTDTIQGDAVLPADTVAALKSLTQLTTSGRPWTNPPQGIVDIVGTPDSRFGF